MVSLKIDDGYKEYMVNNDPDRVIRVNLTDFAILERIDTANKAINEIMAGYKDVTINPDGSSTEQIESTVQAVKSISNLIRQQIDYIFNAPISNVVFGNQSPISSIKGQPYFVRFLDAILPEIEKEIKAEQKASEQRVNKYIKAYKK